MNPTPTPLPPLELDFSQLMPAAQTLADQQLQLWQSATTAPLFLAFAALVVGFWLFYFLRELGTPWRD